LEQDGPAASAAGDRTEHFGTVASRTGTAESPRSAESAESYENGGFVSHFRRRANSSELPSFALQSKRGATIPPPSLKVGGNLARDENSETELFLGVLASWRFH
jgi:hypothetical protein